MPGGNRHGGWLQVVTPEPAADWSGVMGSGTAVAGEVPAFASLPFGDSAMVVAGQGEVQGLQVGSEGGREG